MKRWIEMAGLGVGTILLPQLAVAHPGLDHHGTLLDGLLHLISSLDHLLPLLLGVAVVALLLRRRSASE